LLFTMKIAVCNDIREFGQDRLADREWSCRFPGTGWVTHLYERSQALGIEVASGDVALSHVRSGRWRASEVHVVQELDARDGIKLCQLGSRPLLLTLFESPMVAFRSFDRLQRSRIPFDNCLGPRVLIDQMTAQRHSRLWPMTFPSFWSSEMRKEDTVRGACPVVLVAANKHVAERSRAGLKDHVRYLKRSVRRCWSQTFRRFGPKQLHDQRLGVLVALAECGAIEVFGSGWDRLQDLPVAWATALKPHTRIFRGPCKSKHQTMRGYRMALVFENVDCPGYITEKVVDAMAAGCVPLYRGASDITDYIPSTSIITIGERDHPVDIANQVLAIDTQRLHSIVAAGREFLTTPRGLRHTYEGFAHWVMNLPNERGDREDAG